MACSITIIFVTCVNIKIECDNLWSVMYAEKAKQISPAITAHKEYNAIFGNYG